MSVPVIDPKTLNAWLAEGNTVLIDVREPEEYAQEAIQGAVLIPLGTLNLSLLPDCAGKKLVIQCRSGRRSHVACEMLMGADQSLKPINLAGGILAWMEDGLPVQPGNTKR